MMNWILTQNLVLLSMTGGSFLLTSFNLFINIKNFVVITNREFDKITQLTNDIDELYDKANKIAQAGAHGDPGLYSENCTAIFNRLNALENQLSFTQQIQDVTPELVAAVENIHAYSTTYQNLKQNMDNAFNSGNMELYYNYYLETTNLETLYLRGLHFIKENLEIHINNKMLLYKEISKIISSNNTIEPHINSKILQELYKVTGRNNSAGGASNFTGDNVWELFEKLNEWLITISPQENLALVNLSGILFIMLTLFSIIMIFYGNKFLDYFQLEKRLPKIAKLIILRRKFQQFYLLTNILLISVVLLIMFTLNLLMFTS